MNNFNSIKVRLEPMVSVLVVVFHLDFNSIKVRLEPLDRFCLDLLRSRFQFHKGTIRTHSYEEIFEVLINFNSIKVQLELLRPHLRLLHRNFNSIKVQLELKGDYRLRPYMGFQFHKGTIRTTTATSLSRTWWIISIP